MALAEQGRPPGARQYQAMCVVALIVVVMTDWTKQSALVTLLIGLVGLFGILSRASLSPILFLGAIGAAQLLRQFAWRRFGGRPFSPDRPFEPVDIAMCLGILGYVICHYRWQGLMHHILPVDPRRRMASAGGARDGRQRRSPGLATPAEWLWIYPMVVVCPAVALFAWFGLVRTGSLLDFPDWFRRLVWFAWPLAIGIFVCSAIMGVWRQWCSEPAQAQLVLQDALWQETRGDQRRLNRWLIWSRLRRQGRQ
jgi:hypothetical protein